MKNKYLILLFAILLFGFTLRTFNIDWDKGYHLHPDERAIVLYTLPLQFPPSLFELFSIESTWNPHFFAYGSFPLYLLKIISSYTTFIDPQFAEYSKIQIIGRIISALFDTGTIFLVFLIGRQLFSKKIGVIAALFYTLSVLPIQLSHFFTVDTILTFFILATLLALLRFYENPTIKKAISIGILFAFALATKISASVLIVSVGIALFTDILLIITNNTKKILWINIAPQFAKHIFLYITIICLSTIGTYVILQPYTIIDFEEFLKQTLAQQQMTKDAFTFPYTLQYVGKISYVYELQQIFLFGLGPIIATLAFIGSIIFTYISFKNIHDKKNGKELIITVFFWSYFLIVGSFAIGFMRYMLPVYPLLCIFAAIATKTIFHFTTNKFPLVKFPIVLFFSVLLLLWPMSFMEIYKNPPTRHTATEWILQNIPPNKTIAIEHWDDSLPLTNQELYKMEVLELYNADTPEKWDTIQNQLNASDYIILASNRLYIPLSKLSNCSQLPPGKCYKETEEYYKKLFSGELGYTKIAEFNSYPEIPLLKIPINDSFADESFTVYDHPEVIIFKK